jgi:hypothetical protein
MSLNKQINRVENRIRANDAKRKAQINYIKNTLSSPIVLPIVLVSSVVVSVLVLRKKPFRNVFAYLTTLTLATSNLYRNFKVGMNLVEKIQDARNKTVKKD